MTTAYARESRARILAGQHPPGLINRGHWGFRAYVTPSWAMRDLIESHKHRLQWDYTPPQTGHNGGTVGTGRNPDEGWREVLAQRIHARGFMKYEACIRRTYGVMNGEQRTVNVEWCDNVCLVLGLDIDRDTTLPILPGNLHVAKDLIACRAESIALTLSNLELQRLAHHATRLSALVTAYPGHTERLLDLAPLNCLRPPRCDISIQVIT